MKRACLVSGGSGFIGRHLLPALSARGRQAYCVGRRSVPGYDHILADITRPIDLHGRSFSEVYHLAGLAHTLPRNETENKEFLRINLEGTKNLLEALERGGRLPETIVLVSTILVYGRQSGVLLDENTPREAADSYGASKRMAEDFWLEWGARLKVKTAIARLPVVVGRGVHGNLAAMVRAIKGGWYFGVGPGSARRSMVMAEDLCSILPRMAEVGGIFHLTDGHHPSFLELEEALARALGKPIPKRLPLWLARTMAGVGDGMRAALGKAPFDSRALEKMTSTLTFSDQPARELLDWKPTPVLERITELIS